MKKIGFGLFGATGLRVAQPVCVDHRSTNATLQTQNGNDVGRSVSLVPIRYIMLFAVNLGGKFGGRSLSSFLAFILRLSKAHFVVAAHD